MRMHVLVVVLVRQEIPLPVFGGKNLDINHDINREVMYGHLYSTAASPHL